MASAEATIKGTARNAIGVDSETLQNSARDTGTAMLQGYRYPLCGLQVATAGSPHRAPAHPCLSGATGIKGSTKYVVRSTTSTYGSSKVASTAIYTLHMNIENEI